MPPEEQILRNRSMQWRLSRYTVRRWVDDFIDTLNGVKETQQKLAVNLLTEKSKTELVERYKKSRRRCCCSITTGRSLDSTARPEQARPDDELITILKKLAADKINEVVIISGRDRTASDSKIWWEFPGDSR